MLKVLFLIHDLGQGGAEKVLVNLVNNMDRYKFDISVTVLFGGGVNEQFLKPDIHFRAVFPKEVPGNSKLMKLLTPKQLHKMCVKEHYDIEVSYLEGPSARVISGCRNPDTKLVCWIHSTIRSAKDAAASFRNVAEAQACYEKFHRVVCVSRWTRRAFMDAFPSVKNVDVLYNTVESDKILAQAGEPVFLDIFGEQEISLISVGRFKPVKALDRLIRIHFRMRRDGFPVHTYLLGQGPDLEKLRALVLEYGCSDSESVTFLGYDTNPYKYMRKSDLLVCSSYSEGFSTAATEALIVGTPVCTVEVSGMKELLGENNEYGIVTENDEEALYRGIRCLLEDPALLAHYREKAKERGKSFSTESTVRAAEEMLDNL